MPTTIGFSDHSGWAVLAVLSGEPREPHLVFRRRVQLCPDHLPRQAYHAVAEAGAPVEVIAEVRVAASGLASKAIAGASAEAGGLAAVGIAMGRIPVPDDIAKVLASHTLLHSAEGELYRDILNEASTTAGLRIVRYLNKEVRSEAAAAIGMPFAEFEAKLTAMGKLAGTPWTNDEKDATAAAWLALATISSH